MSKTIVAVVFVLAAITTPSAAQEWPAKTITLVVPFAAGGGIDASARLQAAALGEILGQNVIVENVGAAAGTVGSARVARAAPDGYTLLIGNTGTHAFSQSLYQKPPYDALRDFEPIGLVSESPAYSYRQQKFAGQQPAGVHRLCEGKPEEHAIWLGRGGLRHASAVRAAQHGDGRRRHARPLSRCRSGDAGPDRGTHRLFLRHHSNRDGAGQGRRRQGHRRDVARPRAGVADLATTGEQGLPGVEATVWNAFFFPKEEL